MTLVRVAALVVLLLAALAAGVALRSAHEPVGSALASPVPTPSATATPAVNSLAATWYARDYGVPLEEAFRRLALQDDIGRLGASLETAEASTFAGLWIEHTPRFRVIARFTRGGAKTLSRYVVATPLASLIEARTATYTLARLREDIAAIAANLSYAPFTAGINVQENRIDVQVDSREELEAFTRSRGFQLPPTAYLVVMGPSGPIDCEGDPGAQHGVFFPRHCTRPWQPVPAGAIEGLLVLREGCVWIEPAHGREIYLALWPPGWVAAKAAAMLEIRDAAGARMGAIGERIAAGGGERSDEHDIAQLIRRDPPPACRGHRAWLVTGLLRR